MRAGEGDTAEGGAGGAHHLGEGLGGRLPRELSRMAAGGLAESIVDGSTGLLVETVDELHDALLGLLTDPARCRELGRAARSHAAQFSWAATAHAFSTVVRSSRDPLPQTTDPHHPVKEFSRW